MSPTRLLKRGLQSAAYRLPFTRYFRMDARLRQLERRVYNRRWVAIEEMADYLVGAQVPGDYCEFGVFKGETFGYACRILRAQALRHMRLIAFDSFEGLPEPKGIDAEGGYTSNFHQGEFACSQEQVERNIRAAGADMSRVTMVKGWFDETLNDETSKEIGLEKIAAAWIDGDLYESTVPVLKFLTSRISVGTIILFDDWRVFRNLPDYGEQRACREWLEENPGISLRELFSFGHHGIAYTVASC